MPPWSRDGFSFCQLGAQMVSVVASKLKVNFSRLQKSTEKKQHQKNTPIQIIQIFLMTGLTERSSYVTM
jgi:hypothetical protein